MTKSDEILSWQNGSWIPNSRVGCSLFDSHYMLGCAVFDAMRTYNHKVFKLDDHLHRFNESINKCGYKNNYTMDQIKDVIYEVMDVNQRFFPVGEEYRFMIYYSPGTFDIYKDCVDTGSVLTVNVTQCSRYAPFVYPYLVKGIKGYLSTRVQIPNICIDSSVKHCSRLHYYMAEQEGGYDSMPVILDSCFHVAESSGANIGFFKDKILHIPKWDNILHGVTMQTCLDVWDGNTLVGDWVLNDLLGADSLFFTSTFRGIIPCYNINIPNKNIKFPNKHNSVNKLIDLFDSEVGLDTRRQWEGWYNKNKEVKK
jgi:branched-chain amino acid aminotransferase